MTRVAVCSRSFSRNPTLRRELGERYQNVTLNEAGLSLSGAALVDYLQGHDKAIVALERLDEAAFEALPELAVVSKFGVGLDMLDIEAMARRGIKLGWKGGLNKRSVSELVISNAIAVLRHVYASNREALSGTWRQLFGPEISGKTVGIVGCGNVGKDLTGLLKPFGCRVLAHDIRDYAAFYGTHGVEPVGLEALLGESDIATLHLPLDASTRNILSAERLALMKPGAILINAARGGLLDEAALKALLMDGHLAGAVLDVFATEPPPDRELVMLENVLTTPHIGGSALEANLAMGRAAIAGLDDALVPEPETYRRYTVPFLSAWTQAVEEVSP
jgi:phosphoglycerate dehydrogenase-like enzyme